MKTILLIVAMGLLLFSCAKADFDYTPTFSNSTTGTYQSLRFERFLASQPESMRDYHIEMKEASSILINYLKLEGSNYNLDISEAEAKALGISRKIYLAHKSQVNKVNEEINNAMAAGNNIKMANPQTTLQRYRNPDVHISLEKGYAIQKSTTIARFATSSISGNIKSEEYNWGSESFTINFNPASISGTCSAFNDYDLVALHIVSVSITDNNNKWSSPDQYVTGTKACQAVSFLIYITEDFDTEKSGMLSGTVKYKASHPNGGRCSWTLTERKKADQ